VGAEKHTGATAAASARLYAGATAAASARLYTSAVRCLCPAERPSTALARAALCPRGASCCAACAACCSAALPSASSALAACRLPLHRRCCPPPGSLLVRGVQGGMGASTSLREGTIDFDR
jgi:hypothetical protein